MRYAVVIEKAVRNYSAYVPDLPGCIATGASIDQILVNVREALTFHLAGMRNDGTAPPRPTTLCQYIAVSFPLTQRHPPDSETPVSQGGVQASFREMVKGLACPTCGANFTDFALNWAEAWREGRCDLIAETRTSERDGPYKVKCEFCHCRAWLNYFAGTVRDAEAGLE